MIEVRNVSKVYGDKKAVDNLSFTAQPGMVTGFVGPNGSGKSTTMRMMVGLARITEGDILINGKSFQSAPSPMGEVGAMLDIKAFHPGRSARSHLLILARSNRISAKRVDEVLEMVGLSEVAKKRAGGFSLGMSQRLGIAAALLGDPQTLILDEPLNGLDPQGIRWMRALLAEEAAAGKTVLVSSHLINEMAMTAEQIIVIGKGQLITAQSVSDLQATASTTLGLRVRTDDVAALRPLLVSLGGTITDADAVSMLVTGIDAKAISRAALDADIAITGLTEETGSLEDAFFELTDSSVEYSGKAAQR